VWCSFSDIGWVVGHSYIVYGPLLEGATTVLYEGKPVGTPDVCPPPSTPRRHTASLINAMTILSETALGVQSGAYWRVISQHGVNVSFMAPTAVRAIRKEDPEGSNIAMYGTCKSLSL
jgi:propionyl-CoA synthetase